MINISERGFCLYITAGHFSTHQLKVGASSKFLWNWGIVVNSGKEDICVSKNKEKQSAACSCRCWAEPRAAGQRGRRNPVLGARLELPDDLRVRLEGRVSGCSVHTDGGIQHRGGRGHGKYEQGKAEG